MRRLFSWVQAHLLATVLLIVIGVLLLDRSGGVTPLSFMENGGTATGIRSGSLSKNALPYSGGGVTSDMMPLPPEQQDFSPVDTQDRLVVRDTSLSLVVKDVASSLSAIQSKAEQLGGYLINSHLSRPEEAATGTISVRVPEGKRDEALSAFRSQGVRVVDEQVNGQDVTDQYVDLAAKLTTLTKTKEKFESILDKAEKIQDILQVQQQIVNLQSQIDAVKGQQQLLEQTAKLTRITAYLSTDEFSLPYAPKQPWRPDVVFKTAVRSLVLHARSLGTALIWIGVYSVIWIPLLAIVWLLSRRKRLKLS